MGTAEIVFLTLGAVVGAAVAALFLRGRSARESDALQTAAQEAKASLAAAESELARERQASQTEIDRREALRAQTEVELRHHAASTARAEATADGAAGRVAALESERDAARAERDGKAAQVRRLEMELAAAQTQATHAVSAKAEGLATRDEVCQRLIDSEKGAATSREAGLRAGYETALEGLKTSHAKAESESRDVHARELRSRDAQIADQKAYIASCDAALEKAFGDASAKALNDAMKGFNEQAQARFKEEQERACQRSEDEKREISRLLEPMHKELADLEELSTKLEASRVKAEGALDERLQRIQHTSESLANALKKPGVRGAWGEQQLKRILDGAGMSEGVNYRLQDHTDEEGEGLRTDVIIMLPKGREVVIDSKAPLDHYSAAMNATTDEDRNRSAEAHARSVRSHFRALRGKEYWRRYAGSPDCVVLFMPYEGAYQLACEHDKELLSDCNASKIILANPMTLMGLVHVAGFALQEDRMKGDIEKVRDAGMSLCQRLGHVLGLLAKHRKHLGTAVESYNEIVGSVERRLLPSTRTMERLGFSDANIASMPTALQANIRILPVGESEAGDQALLSLPDPDEVEALA